MRLALALALLAVPSIAQAHGKPPERAILQFRADATQILYEVNIPAGPEAVRWRQRFDTNFDGRLAPAEFERLARGLGEAVRDRLRLRLDGVPMPVSLDDAKVTPSEGPDPLSGKLAAIVLLSARELPPGLRRIELEGTPLVDPRERVIVRLEAPGARIESIVGGGRADTDDGAPAVVLRAGLRSTLRIDVPRANAR